MRIDKYLQVSRIIKRRVIAKQLADNQRIKVNDVICKAYTNIKINDIIEITLGLKVIKVKVIELRDFTRADTAFEMYEIIDNYKITRSEDDNKS